MAQRIADVGEANVLTSVIVACELRFGAAYVFERVGSTWQQQRRLEPSDTHAVNDFGEAVAIRGEELVQRLNVRLAHRGSG